MEDTEFLQSFEEGTLPKSYFDQRSLLRVAWLYLRSFGYDKASSETIHRLKDYATKQGDDTLFHETLTRVWIYLVHRSIEINPYAETFEEFIALNDYLLDSKLPLQYYSPELLYCEKAREQWVIPDIRPFMDV